ncbi:TPA: hypothetical protein TUM56_000939 [Streptococcus equi subsp. zooepidemicus]|nr:hypothetical protein [Streptococcus equi subsp. zooepidemicus]HEL0114785.1 hypothetical protein [Streptococcus equi subsp. zooepidemicus]HEL0116883.1 hypothetical protein [Streptococcus equi subsp. zooepidemicus]HEL0118894.1 hypothetical protein [Streptococcus equi subsp. zooepidemicus]HEL0122902.1 hypothetical protein [Streptococcus equi subsp. zooepidemicus]
MFGKLLSLLGFVVALTGCGVSQAEKERVVTEYSPTIIKKFQTLGYQGKITVDDYTKMIETGSERLYFTYSEEVDGKVISLKDSISIATYKSPEEDLADAEVDMGIREEAMWQQPAVKSQTAQIKQLFSELETEDLKLISVTGQSVQTISDSDGELIREDVVRGRNELSQDVSNNREAGLSIGGYYHIDVSKYLKNHVLEIRIDFDWRMSEEEQDDLSGPRLDFSDRIKSLDFTCLWDGYYKVGFDRVSRSSRSGDIQDMIVLDIRGGKLVCSFSVL